jgi:hypothetical protein
LLLREEKFEQEIDPMWITQLSHWDRALDLQNEKESPDQVTTFNAFNTRMICCELPGAFIDSEADVQITLLDNSTEDMSWHKASMRVWMITRGERLRTGPLQPLGRW